MSELHNQDVFTAGLVIIGNEILSGRTHDTNTVWIAEQLTKKGIILTEVRIVPDIEDKIVEAVNALRGQLDYVFTTGGIGPTHDDITAQSIAKAFDVPLEENVEARRVLEEYYGPDEINEARLKMAQAPVGAGLIPNPVSGAPGFIIENVYVMAGIPRVMQAMMDHLITTHLKHGQPVLSHMVSCSLPESVLAAGLKALQDETPNVEIGSYPHFRGGVFGLNLVLRSTDEGVLRTASEKLIKIIHDLGGETGTIGFQPAPSR